MWPVTSEDRRVAFSIARVVGITAPAIYSGITFSHSRHAIPPILEHAPTESLLGKQWYTLYRTGPRFVPPLILSGTIANLVLAKFTHPLHTLIRIQYAAAAALTFAILPITFTIFEPGVNGMGKWKLQELLKTEGFSMVDNEALLPNVEKHTATEQSKRRAETVTMREIVTKWAEMNLVRAEITILAALSSAVATILILS